MTTPRGPRPRERKPETILRSMRVELNYIEAMHLGTFPGMRRYLAELRRSLASQRKRGRP
jgi:hypothetical protein